MPKSNRRSVEVEDDVRAWLVAYDKRNGIVAYHREKAVAAVSDGSAIGGVEPMPPIVRSFADLPAAERNRLSAAADYGDTL